MYFDGAFSLQGVGAGVLLVAPNGEHLKYIVQMHFPKEQATNNTVEYEGLFAGLRIAAELGIKKLIVRGDSQLVVRQVNKSYQSPLMEAYVDEVRKLEEHFEGLQMEHVPRHAPRCPCRADVPRRPTARGSSPAAARAPARFL